MVSPHLLIKTMIIFLLVVITGLLVLILRRLSQPQLIKPRAYSYLSDSLFDHFKIGSIFTFNSDQVLYIQIPKFRQEDNFSLEGGRLRKKLECKGKILLNKYSDTETINHIHGCRLTIVYAEDSTIDPEMCGVVKTATVRSLSDEPEVTIELSKAAYEEITTKLVSKPLVFEVTSCFDLVHSSSNTKDAKPIAHRIVSLNSVSVDEAPIFNVDSDNDYDDETAISF